MGIAPDLTTSLDALRGVQVPDEMTGDDAVEALTCALKLRHVAEHLAAMLTGVLNRCGVAASQGRTPRELLIALGCAPSVAQRLIRVGAALPSLPTLAAHAGDGAIS
ncbi:MAG: HNH endonuclease, partial [Mycolicibacterium sp.]